MAGMFYKWLMFPVVCIAASTVLQPDNAIATFSMANAVPPGVSSFSSGVPRFHPYYVSVTEINHNAADKTLELTCKIFTDDFEKTLAEKYQKKVDLMNPTDKAGMDKLINEYIKSNLLIKAEGKAVNYTYLGFEREEEAVYSYFQVENVTAVKKIEVSNSILHDLTPDQINILHVTVGGTRKSTKLNFPDKDAVFNF